MLVRTCLRNGLVDEALRHGITMVNRVSILSSSVHVAELLADIQMIRAGHRRPPHAQKERQAHPGFHIRFSMSCSS